MTTTTTITNPASQATPPGTFDPLLSARLLVCTLVVARKSGEFFALHPQQLTDTLCNLEMLLAEVAARSA